MMAPGPGALRIARFALLGGILGSGCGGEAVGYPQARYPSGGRGRAGAGAGSSGTSAGAGSSTGSAAASSASGGALAASSSSGGACANAGQSCSPSANSCDRGLSGCDAHGQPTCSDQGPDSARDGTACTAVADGVCRSGTCVSCSPGAACTPSNPCDLGSTACANGLVTCADRGPDPAKNGLACGDRGAGAVCQAGACRAASRATDGGWPQIPPGSGTVISAPTLVLVTYDRDANRSVLEGSTRWLAQEGYLAKVGGEYGIGNGSLIAVHVDDAPPAANVDALQTYLAGHLADNSFPANSANNIYLLAIPSADSSPFCTNTGGFHTYATDDQGNSVVYAVCPDCQKSVAAQEVTISHEVLEAATDPFVTSYQISDLSNPWTFLGGEVGDLCSSNTAVAHDSTDTYAAQLMWSNRAAAAGQPPCVPWDPQVAYLSVSAAPATTQPVAPGGSVTFTLTGWASMPVTASWALQALDGDYRLDFSTHPTLTSTTLTQGGTTTITLSAPTGAQPGQHGAAWVLCYDPNSLEGFGSTMVAVVVE